MNSFNLSNQGLSFLWQEMRDSADWATKMAMTDVDAKTRLGVAALGNEAAADKNKADLISGLGAAAVSIFNKWND